MIDATNILGPQSGAGQAKQPTREDIAGGFSFVAAMSALEGRAAQSLETFGAAPQGANPGAASATSTPRQETTSQASKGAPPSPANEASTSTQTAEKSTITTDNGSKTPTPAQLASSSPPVVVQAAPVAQAAIAPTALQTQLTTQIRTADITIAKLADPAKTNAPKAPQAATQPPAPTQDFARLVAQRLSSGATSFDLRLDPPELGRVEASLQVADDGDAVLALKFESQSTLDLFARDEAALRNALLSSGFNLGGERLAFSLSDDPHAAGTATSDVLAASDPYEPVFHAPYSNGAVDIRI